MKWVTRKNAKVDRIACPWLIRRFVDADAEFLYVAVDEVPSVAKRESATPYDVAGVELGHVDGRCSFESILLKYGIHGPALQVMGRIVHGADIPQDIGIEPEAAGLRAIAEGFSLTFGERDHEKLTAEMPLSTHCMLGARPGWVEAESVPLYYFLPIPDLPREVAHQSHLVPGHRSRGQ